MKKIALTALMLTSTTAFATSTRVASHQGNLGLADGTDYTMLSSLTDDAGNNAWFDYDGANLAGAATFDGNGVSFAQGEDRVDFSWNHASGDTGYRVDLGIASTEAMSVGGAYGMLRWRPGDVVVDVYDLVLEPNFTPGDYTLYFGFFSGKDRLAVSRGKHHENRVVGGVLTVR